MKSPVEAEKPTRGGRRKAPEPKEEAIEPGGLPEVCRKSAGGLPEFGRKCAKFKEHLGRRGWMQCQSKEKGPRYSPGELNPGENVRVQDDKTKYWSKQAKVVKKLSARTYLLKSGSKMFKRNIRFIKAAPKAQDMDPPNITQAIKGENDCRPKVQGSNPTDGQMTRSRMK